MARLRHLATARGGLRRILVQINGLGCHDFARVIMTARGANVMRTLQLAAIVAFLGVARHQCVMRAAHIAFGRGYAILRDSHVKPFVFGDMPLINNDNSVNIRARSQANHCHKTALNEARNIARFWRGASPILGFCLCFARLCRGRLGGLPAPAWRWPALPAPQRDAGRRLLAARFLLGRR